MEMWHKEKINSIRSASQFPVMYLLLPMRRELRSFAFIKKKGIILSWYVKLHCFDGFPCVFNCSSIKNRSQLALVGYGRLILSLKTSNLSPSSNIIFNWLAVNSSICHINLHWGGSRLKPICFSPQILFIFFSLLNFISVKRK